MGKIKVAYITKDLTINGISTVIMNYCEKINKEKYAVTLIAGTPIDENYRCACFKLGIDLIEIPRKKEESRKYYKKIFTVLNRYSYDIVHIHGNSATITAELFIAFICGVKVRIAHCHSISCDHLQVHKMLQPMLCRLSSYGFACSNEAGKWLFKDRKFEVIPNGFDIQRFEYSKEARKEVREKFNFNDAFVIGHVGAFISVKNQLFLLNIFDEIFKEYPNSFLLFVGEGAELKEIVTRAKNMNCSSHVIFVGKTNEVEKYYSAMDIFCFPSVYEGLGLVLLEAQISGLYCISSDKVPNEIDVSGYVSRISLNDKKSWIDTIKKEILLKRRIQLNSDKLRMFDIDFTIKKLESRYRYLLEQTNLFSLVKH